MRTFLRSCLFVLIVTTSSCRYYKNTALIQNANDSDRFTIAREKVFQPGDRINVKIFIPNKDLEHLFAENYPKTFVIDDNGEIFMPTIGNIPVANNNIEQVREGIDAEVKRLFPDASVFVEFSTINYTIIGQVNNPGIYSLGEVNASVFKAIAKAGGAKRNSNLKEVTIIRAVASEEVIIKVDLTDKEIIASENYLIQNNDQIIISPDKLNVIDQLASRSVEIILVVVLLLSI